MEVNMEKIFVYDVTLRDGEQAPGFKMNSDQKYEIAKALADMKVDGIEAGFAASSPGDFNSVRRIAKDVQGPVIASLARCMPGDIKAAGEALAPAIARGQGRIHTFIATSDIHVQNKLRKSREAIIRMAVDGVTYAKSFTPDVEFSCEDFGRSDIGYTIDVVRNVIQAGATTINLPDTVGYRYPTEIEEMVRQVIQGVGIPGIVYSMHAHNDLGMASVNTLYAIRGGARQVEVTINGIGERAGNCALEEVMAGINERPEFFNATSGVYCTSIIPVSRLVSRVTGKYPQLNKAITGGNAFRHSSGIHQDGMLKDSRTYGWIDPERYGTKSESPLTARSGKNQVQTSLAQKEIKFDESKMAEIMTRYKTLADQVDDVFDDILVMAVRGHESVPEYYKLVSYRASIDEQGGQATIEVEVDGARKTVTGHGNGMISATENAFNTVTGMNLDIADYRSVSIEQGGTARGMETILAKNNGFVVRGIGIDEDTVRGAAKAYLDASNKMKYVIENR